MSNAEFNPLDVIDPEEYAYTQAYNAVIGGIYTHSNLTFDEFCKKLDKTYGEPNENWTDENKQIP